MRNLFPIRLVASLILGVLAAQARAAVAPDAYRTALAEALVAGRRAVAAPMAESARARLREARARLPATMTVTRADGQTIQVSNRALLRGLDPAIRAKTLGARREAARRFVSLVETAQAAVEGPAPARASGEVQTLQNVLARREFQQSLVEQWQQRLREWAMDLLRMLFRNVEPAALEVIARLVYWGTVVILAVVLVYLIWTYVPGLRFRRRGGRAQLGDDDVVLIPDRAEEHLARAELFAAAGSYLDALRHVYTAMLLILDHANVLPYDRARTNWEVLRALRGAPRAPLRDLLTPVTRSLDAKLYGGRPATVEDYRWCRAECARLQGLVAT